MPARRREPARARLRPESWRLRCVAWTAWTLALALAAVVLLRSPRREHGLRRLGRSELPPTVAPTAADTQPPAAAVVRAEAVPVEPACADADAERCLDWACGGECTRNAGFMDGSCPCSCAAVAARPLSLRAAPAGATRVVLTPSWTAADGRARSGRLRLTLETADAPLATAAVLSTAASGACAPGAFCGGRCHFHRAETGYGLVQGYLAGLGAGGGAFGSRSEGKLGWKRGTAGYIPGGDNLLIALIDHPEWDTQFTALGQIDEDDWPTLDELQALPTAPSVNEAYKVTMAMLVSKVVFTVELEDAHEER